MNISLAPACVKESTVGYEKPVVIVQVIEYAIRINVVSNRQ